MRIAKIAIMAFPWLVLGSPGGCVVEDASPLDEEGAEDTLAGEETLDDGALDDEDELRSYEGVIAAPLFGLQVRSGTTAGKTNDYGPSCGVSNHAPDVSYTWTAPADGSYTFSTAGSSFDTVLHVRSAATPMATLACNDDFGGTLQSSVTLTLRAGASVIIVVDGHAELSGSFALSIAKANQCPSGCNSPPTQCHRLPGTCEINPFTGDGSCSYPPAIMGEACNDKNSCTLYDSCVGYSCVPDSLLPVGAPCNDGDPCTVNDACSAVGGRTCVGTNVCV